MVWPRKVRLLPNDRQTSQNCHDLSSNVGLLPPPVRSHLPSQYNGSSMSTSTSGVRGSTSVVRSPPNPWPQVKPGHSELDIVGALGGKQSLQRQLPSNVDWSVSVMLHAYPCMTKLSNYHSVLHRRGTGLHREHGLVRRMRRLAQPYLHKFYPVVRPHHECTWSRWLAVWGQRIQLFLNQLPVLSQQPVRRHPWM